MEGTAGIPRKGQDADPAGPTSKEKAELIGALRPKRIPKNLLSALRMPCSGHQYALIAKAHPGKHAETRAAIADVFIASGRRCGFLVSTPKCRRLFDYIQEAARREEVAIRKRETRDTETAWAPIRKPRNG